MSLSNGFTPRSQLSAPADRKTSRRLSRRKASPTQSKRTDRPTNPGFLGGASGPVPRCKERPRSVTHQVRQVDISPLFGPNLCLVNPHSAIRNQMT